MIKTNYDDFLVMVYRNLKSNFNNIDKRNWIWVDFFEDERSGFEHFKSNIESDEDYRYILDELKKTGDVEGFAFDVAYDISCKLRQNDFFHECEQCMIDN